MPKHNSKLDESQLFASLDASQCVGYNQLCQDHQFFQHHSAIEDSDLIVINARVMNYHQSKSCAPYGENRKHNLESLS